MLNRDLVEYLKRSPTDGVEVEWDGVGIFGVEERIYTPKSRDHVVLDLTNEIEMTSVELIHILSTYDMDAEVVISSIEIYDDNDRWFALEIRYGGLTIGDCVMG